VALVKRMTTGDAVTVGDKRVEFLGGDERTQTAWFLVTLENGEAREVTVGFCLAAFDDLMFWHDLDAGERIPSEQVPNGPYSYFGLSHDKPVTRDGAHVAFEAPREVSIAVV